MKSVALAPEKDARKISNKSGCVDPSFWSSRCWFWQDQNARNDRRRGIREKERRPLVLAGHGVSLRVEGGSLAVRNGRTHYPQKVDEFRYFRGDLDLPNRIILLDCSGNISFEAISWLSEQGVAMIKIDWRGGMISVIGGSSYSANPIRLQWQRETRADPKLRMEFCNSLIAQKIDASILTLERSISRQSQNWEKAMAAAYAALTQLEENPPRTVDVLRIIEANAAAAYFSAWRGVPIRWAKRSGRPIPEEWGEIGTRGSQRCSPGNRKATHPVNAILNYAYAVLEGEIRVRLVAEGFDPTYGILHERRADSSAFVYDMIEPKRPIVDRVALKFVSDYTFHPADFVIRSDGTCRLNSEMARYVTKIISAELGTYN